jgi:Uma2 family endonuclease
MVVPLLHLLHTLYGIEILCKALHMDAQVTTVDYPDTDGLPMAESDFQRKPLTYAVEALDIYFQDRADVYVSGNLFLYYREGDPRAVVAPDVFVVFAAEKRDRPSYKLWEEPKAPDFVLEITSKSTRSEDQESKPQTYAQLGVREYVQFDPTGDYLKPPLQGLRLVAGTYELLPVTERPDGTLVLYSAVLELELHVENGRLHFYAAETGQKLLTHREAEQARLQAEHARLQAEQDRVQAEQARLQAEQARLQAEERASQEAALRQAAEARIAELEAQLRAFQARRSPEAP